MNKTDIEWTEMSWNPLVSLNGHWTGPVELIESKLAEPLRRRKPSMIFVNSMSDTFHESLPDEAIDRIMAVIALCPQHKFLVFTKRGRKMRKYFDKPQELFYRWGAVAGDSLGHGVDDRIHQFIDLAHSGDWEEWIGWPLLNLGLGVSCEDRKSLSRLDELRKTPTAMRFLSLEPLLEDLGQIDLTGISWCIVGGETGPEARPCRVEWIESIIEQCRASGTACFVKQLGARPIWAAAKSSPIEDGAGKNNDPDKWPEGLRVREVPDAIQRS